MERSRLDGDCASLASHGHDERGRILFHAFARLFARPVAHRLHTDDFAAAEVIRCC